MGATSPVVYRIDSSDCISEVNANWDEFAEANGAHGLDAHEVVGRPLWGFLADATTKQLYRDMVQRVRAGRAIRFRFRCDASGRRRLLAMKMTPGDGGCVWFTVTSVREDDRVAVAVLDLPANQGDRLVPICGWCKRVRLSATRWVEIEEAVEALGLFHGDVRRLSHAMCPECHDAMMALIEGPEDGPDSERTEVTLGALAP
jgi:hypothetical protein